MFPGRRSLRLQRAIKFVGGELNAAFAFRQPASQPADGSTRKSGLLSQKFQREVDLVGAVAA